MTSICMVFFYLEMQRRLVKTKVYYILYYSVWKEAFHKPLRVAAAKKSFPSVYIIDTTCFHECFLSNVINARHLLYKFIIITQKFREIAMLMCSLKKVFWRKSAFHIRYLYNNITMLLIPKVHNKVSTF